LLLIFWFLFVEDEETSDEDDSYSYKEMMNRDKRRWEKADKDGDGFLTKEEFADFLHPEDAEHMRDIVIQVSCAYLCVPVIWQTYSVRRNGSLLGNITQIYVMLFIPSET